MTLCALTFSNASFTEEALKYLLRIAAKLTSYSMQIERSNVLVGISTVWRKNWKRKDICIADGKEVINGRAKCECEQRRHACMQKFEHTRTDDVKVIGCDGTNVNTRHTGGVIRQLEVTIEHSLQWFVCLLHANELPLRHLIQHLDGSTTGPRGFSLAVTLFTVRSTRYGVRGLHNFWGPPVAQQPLPSLVLKFWLQLTNVQSVSLSSLYKLHYCWNRSSGRPASTSTKKWCRRFCTLMLCHSLRPWVRQLSEWVCSFLTAHQHKKAI